jgi:hypothetical protein
MNDGGVGLESDFHVTLIDPKVTELPTLTPGE